MRSLCLFGFLCLLLAGCTRGFEFSNLTEVAFDGEWAISRPPLFSSFLQSPAFAAQKVSPMRKKGSTIRPFPYPHDISHLNSLDRSSGKRRRPAAMLMAGRTNPLALAAAAGIFLVMSATAISAKAKDENHVFQPCADAKIQRSDGFTFGIAFSDHDSFFFNATQLSPCDNRLPLSSKGAQLAVFRPKVDEISLLTVNTTTSFAPVTSGGLMVAFAGRKYAARSLPIFVGNSSYVVTSFTLVLEFQKGTLQNLFWKRDGCASCSGKSNFVCLNKQ